MLYAQEREEALLVLQSEIRNSFDVANGVSRIKTKVKFSELADQYLEDYAKVNNLAWKRVQSCLKQLNGFFGKHYLQSITPLLIEKYKQKRLSEGIMPASVNREMSVLKRSFNLAITWKMTKENPVKEVRFLRQPEPRERILTEEEEKSQFVFLYVDPKTGQMKHLQYFRRAFEAACSRAKIIGLTFHDLRHTFASRLVRSGVDLITVKDLLGHYSVRITERYTHSNKEQKRKAVELLNVQTSGKKTQKVVNLSLSRHTEEDNIRASLRNSSVFN